MHYATARRGGAQGFIVQAASGHAIAAIGQARWREYFIAEKAIAIGLFTRCRAHPMRRIGQIDRRRVYLIIGFLERLFTGGEGLLCGAVEIFAQHGIPAIGRCLRAAFWQPATNIEPVAGPRHGDI